MRLLILGGSGYLGQHLVDSLSRCSACEVRLGLQKAACAGLLFACDMHDQAQQCISTGLAAAWLPVHAAARRRTKFCQMLTSQSDRRPAQTLGVRSHSAFSYIALLSTPTCMQIVHTRCSAAAPPPSTAARTRSVRCDSTDTDSVDHLFREHGPFDAIVNTVAVSQPGKCQQDPTMARYVNALRTKSLVDPCGQSGAACTRCRVGIWSVLSASQLTSKNEKLSRKCVGQSTSHPPCCAHFKRGKERSMNHQTAHRLLRYSYTSPRIRSMAGSQQ